MVLAAFARQAQLRVLASLKGGVGYYADGGREALDYRFGVGHAFVMAGPSFAVREAANPAVRIGYYDGFASVPFLLPRVVLVRAGDR
jgi:hypothetical protein